MAHISLELPDELTLHVGNAAQKLGVSPHSFMVAAIFRATHAVEGRRALLEQARSAREDTGYDADEVTGYPRHGIAKPRQAMPGKKQ